MTVEMAQQGVKLNHEKFCCSICLDLLTDPVTISCGHSYCMNCIKAHWDKEDEKKIHSCPQCGQTFTSRPVLGINTMLAVLVKELKKPGLQAAPADLCYAGPEDVACDVCTGTKLTACKSCLQCATSFCEKHLQPHDVAPLKKHKLVEPSKKLQENICSRHNEVMKLFCRTDQQCICYLCSMEEHKGHKTVSAAAVRTERQRELKGTRQNIQQGIQNREKGVKLLKQEMKAIKRSADKAVKDNEKIFTELISLLEKRSSDVKQQVRSQQETEMSRVKELQEKLEQEITELKRKDAELKQLAHTEDHNQFLHNYASLSVSLSESREFPNTKICPLQYFEDVTAAVSEVRDQLQDVLSEKWTTILRTVSEVDVLLSHQLRAREEFLQYACQITLDPNTAHPWMILSEGNRKVTHMRNDNSISFSPTRFFPSDQVLSRESLTGRCYWEVEMDGVVTIAVAYNDMSRSGTHNEFTFGLNKKSWTLHSSMFEFQFIHDNIPTLVPGKPSSIVGVFLDHKAGILSFYDVSDTMTLLHTVKTTFTQPLYAGIGLHFPNGDNAKLCELK